MSVDITKLQFSSDYVADKMVYESDVISYSVGATTATTKTVTNPYGIKAFVTMIWSVDGTNYVPMQSTVSSNYVTQYTANAWCDASNVYLYLENNTNGALTFYLKFVLDSIT
jgi:hypothetical protein